MDREFSTNDRRRRLVRRWLKPILIVALLAAAGKWALAGLRPGLDVDRLRLAEVTVAPLESVLVASGTVQPARERVLTSPLPARLVEVLRHPGSRVTPGDAVLELDLAASRLEAGQLNDQIQQQRARLRRLQLESESARVALQTQKDVKALERDEADFDLEQQRALFDQGLVSEIQLSRGETRARRIALELEGLEQRLTNSYQAAEAELEEADTELSSRLRRRDQLLADLDRASTRVEQEGVVTWVVDDEGSMLNPGQPLARVADLGSFRIEATISNLHGGRLFLDQPVRLPITGDANPETLTGRIDRILPAVDEGSLSFWVRLDDVQNSSKNLRVNQRLEVWVIADALPLGQILTKAGYYTGPGPHQLFVLSPDRREAVRRTVELGVAGRRSVQVISGLKIGESVVISDVSNLKHLTRWTVKP